ncbi:MAG TPA: bifunctional phosphopantothenoylcysteine decarboxylase/phosphopantothenate--cysteine ligase CoaBC, partial [Bacteroidia bacterium]|nr:bifunctional phosphopantothenoylcysteine decarboxylase/phosphopantothenate--cysteine ligase CoaBC [Bacteroidia bacterium]
SKKPVLTHFTEGHEGVWNNHVELGLWADLIVIAPATANTISDLLHGKSENILQAVFLSARCPVAIAPAMDLDMYRHPATQENLDALSRRGTLIIPPGTGELASGLVGEGRMAEPEEIYSFIGTTLLHANRLSGKKVLLTAGPTYEPIDAVRFVGNFSTGKMGIALANTLAQQGAEVTLVCGPTKEKNIDHRVHKIDVVTAKEMFDVCVEKFPGSDAAVLTAAVADFRPKTTAKGKIKKEEGGLSSIELEQTQDILATLGGMKKSGQVLAGFALETDNEAANAQGKLKRKNLDFIVMNSLRDDGAGFGTDTNKITVFSSAGKTHNFELKPKSEVAQDISDILFSYLSERTPTENK